MENRDSIEHKFRSSFSDFEPEPPSGVWENLCHELHPEPKQENFWLRITGSSLVPAWHIRRYMALAGAAIIFFLAIVYFASNDHHSIRGHAYAGESRLCRGVAVLFRIADKLKPWDSVSHYRSAIIDDQGNYKFSRVKRGTYLLRISPEESSETAKMFMPSWFDQHESPDSSHVILLKADDVNADVHLLAKRRFAK